MIVEAVCIILILIVAIFMFLRAHKKTYAIVSAPLLILPFVQAATNILNEIFNFPNFKDICAVADIVALSVSLALIGLLANMFKTKKTKAAYIIVSGSYTLILCFIFLYNTYIIVNA